MHSKVEEVRSGVFHLQFEIPYNVQPVNIYLLAGSPVTLIDTGPIMQGVEETVFRLLGEAGFPPSSLERIIITHHHPDHMGLAGRLKARSAAEVVCHRLGEPMVRDYAGEARRLVDYLVGVSAYMGLDRNLVEATVKKTSDWSKVAEGVAVDRLLEDGNLLAGDPFTLRAIHTPGHCIDHLCMYLEEEKLLFTGDMLLSSITPNPDLYPPWQSYERSGLPGYLRSLEKISKLDVELALPGHGALILDFPGRVAVVLEHHRERMDYIAGVLRGRRMTVLELALDLLDFIGADRTPENIFLAMREVFGHLILLEREGRTAEMLDGETAFFYNAE